MRRARVRDILDRGDTGATVTVCGWVRSRRETKGVAFIALSDGSCQDTLQLVIPSGTEASRELPACTTGASIRAVGTVKESPGRGQKIEVEVARLEVFGSSDPERYPLQKKGHSLEFLREIGHLRPRTNTFGAVFRIRNILADAVHRFFQDRGFVWVHTPVLTSSDCEGAGDLFTVTTLDPGNPPRREDGSVDFSEDFFGRRAYLTVSGQLEAEFLAMALGDVYTFGPAFRAENSNTSRHLSEFWMVEPEMAFADLDDDISLAEDFLKTLCRAVLEKGEEELAFLEKWYGNTSVEGIRNLAERPFARISYTEAVNEFKGAGREFEFPVRWGLDLQSEHERFLAEDVFNGPVVVTDYPREIKAFYMRLNDDGRTVAAMDVLVPGVGEIIGGSQREERLDLLKERMKEAGMSADGLQWYLDLRRYGSAPHAGFGLGFDRLVQYLSGMQNIRDVIPCPRTPGTIRL